MARARSTIAFCSILMLSAICGGQVSVTNGDSQTAILQRAIESLRRGQHIQAESTAMTLVHHEEFAYHRAWLVVAAARQRRGRYKQAVQAYKSYLTSCSSREMRSFVLKQIDLCLAALRPARKSIAPSKRLGRNERKALAKVDTKVHMDATEHFTVRTRNAKLTKLISQEAEKALRRICNIILAGQDYPHVVDIYVWPDHKEFLANATDAPEWAGGSFTFSVSKGVVTRRLDLTQRDKDGQLAAVMLDRVLPHEMCHLVVREFFGDAACPLMLKEGLAMMAEPEVNTKRILLAGQAIMGQKNIPLDKLLTLHRAGLMNPLVFYAESYSFVSFLHDRMTRQQFKALLEHVKGGCTISDAIQRALFVPYREDFITTLTAAWENHAIADAQYIQALRLKRRHSTSRPVY